MKNIFTLMVLAGALLMASVASATPAANELFALYKSKGAAGFDAERGKKVWTKEIKSEGGEMLSCTTCHGADLSKDGKHHKTGKLIKPMAPSANAERFTDAKKIEKWFKRNCNDVWSRECTAQEKGDILKFLLSK
jgi:cytochrome c553